jgi:hypothetical protein
MMRSISAQPEAIPRYGEAMFPIPPYRHCEGGAMMRSIIAQPEAIPAYGEAMFQYLPYRHCECCAMMRSIIAQPEAIPRYRVTMFPMLTMPSLRVLCDDAEHHSVARSNPPATERKCCQFLPCRLDLLRGPSWPALCLSVKLS